MQRWRTENKSLWLCRPCVRQLMPVIIRSSWEWVEESSDAALCCERCKCTEHLGERFGGLRHLVRILSLIVRFPFRLLPPRSKAWRRAI
ncbi:MAG TPA: hypothetical protein ENK33_05270 [Desulfobacterales bacterium]|nr:hypothetical protein [Desulfobacterales bacterium]